MRHETTRERCIVGEGRAAVAAGATPWEEGGAAVDGDEPPSLDRDSLHSPDSVALAAVTTGDGLRERVDLLAAVPYLDPPQRLETVAPAVAARVELGRRDRLESRGPRQFDGGRKKGGNILGPNPTDKGRAGCKRHLVVDAQGVPLAALLTPANVHDSAMLEAVLDEIPPLKRRTPGRPQRRPVKLHADKGYDYHKCRAACQARGITPRIARRGIESSERLGQYRWVVERDFAWLNAMRRLRTRYDRRASHYLGFLHLGCALICFNYLSAL